MSSSTEQPTTFRNIWRSVIDVSELKEAADTRATYHERRYLYWASEAEAAAEEFHESAQVKGHEVTGGMQYQLVADQDVAAKLSQAQSKAKAHFLEWRKYAAWVGFLDTMHTNTKLEITIQDAEFFWVGVQAPDEVMPNDD